MDDGESMVVQGNKSIEEETYARIEKYFSFALAIASKDRIAWLERVLCDDMALLKEVKLLLKAHDSADTFLAEAAPVKETIDAIVSRCPDLTGRRLGVYEVVAKIARGGMGRIYSAKRVDGEYEQIVAIKVMERANFEIGLFQKERQLLADIQHPNIVTLLDGGTLPEGFPYLVMELVDGIAIDRYVNSHPLNTNDIVTLCYKLCGVVDDAHQLGIIHCDLKPDNILVINQGSLKGTLKLLDFGIAQSLSSSKTVSDADFKRLTPEYASPQRHYNKVPHVSDDVFSLGVILTQLLSGQPLALMKKTSLLKKSYQAPDIQALIAAIENKELLQILQKATSDTCSNRYQSARALQNDLKNWLDEKPIDAAQGGLVYFYSKYIYRYRRIAFIITVLALLALIVGQLTGQHLESQESRELREHNAVEVVNDLDNMLAGISYTPRLEKEVTTLTLRRLQRWNQETPDSYIIKKHYADILTRLGNISGHPYYLNLGEKEEAHDYYRKALSLYQALDTLTESKLDESALQVATIHQSYLKHRLVELEIYEKGYENSEVIHNGWKAMLDIEERLASQQFVDLPPKQHLLVMSMLLASAYESLRIKRYSEARVLLMQVKNKMQDSNINSDHYAHEQDYLQAFFYEIMGHFYYLQGKVNLALASYSKIKRFNAEDDRLTGRYRYLLTRVDSAFACLGFLQKNKVIKQQHVKYFEYARANMEALALRYKEVPILQHQTEKMTLKMDVRTIEGRKAFCDKPLYFLLPPLVIR